MPYRLCMTGNDIYTFEVESDRGGWAWLRLVRRETDGSVELYNPAVHDGKNSYMSHLWRARGHTEGGLRHYTLVAPFGSPGSTMRLDKV
jgi:hypothetical protein